MLIKREKYDELVGCARMKYELEKEVQRLAEQITAQVTDCKLGPWCKDCWHYGVDSAEIKGLGVLGGVYVKDRCGKVQYCKKHLHEVCPEFEAR